MQQKSLPAGLCANGSALPAGSSMLDHRNVEVARVQLGTWAQQLHIPLHCGAPVRHQLEVVGSSGGSGFGGARGAVVAHKVQQRPKVTGWQRYLITTTGNHVPESSVCPCNRSMLSTRAGQVTDSKEAAATTAIRAPCLPEWAPLSDAPPACHNRSPMPTLMLVKRWLWGPAMVVRVDARGTGAWAHKDGGVVPVH